MRASLLIFIMAALASGQSGPRVTFIKSFPGSSPAYVSIAVERDGRVTYKEAEDDENPGRVKLEQADADALFALADKLGRFQRPLEAPLKVANMGKKTFRYEGEGAPTEVSFNYTQDLDAQALADFFEKLTESQQRYYSLERAVKFDKLGVQQALLHVQMSMDRRRLVAPEQFLPLLDRVAKNASFLNMARERAAAMAESIRAGKPKAE